MLRRLFPRSTAGQRRELESLIRQRAELERDIEALARDIERRERPGHVPDGHRVLLRSMATPLHTRLVGYQPAGDDLPPPPPPRKPQ